MDPARPHGAWSPTWAQIRAVLDAVSDHIWIATPRLDRLLYSNPAYERIYGEPLADLYADPRSFLALLHPDDRERALAAASRPRPHAYEDEFRVQRRDGTTRFVRVRNFPVVDPDGQVALIAGIAEDVTEHRGAAATEHEHRRVLELANVVVFALPDHRIRFWNRGAERLYGYPADEALGRPIHDLLQTRYPEPLDEIVATVRAAGVWDGVFEHRARDGRAITLASRWVRHLEPETGDELIVEINHDITSLVAAQHEAERLRDELDRSERLDALGHLAGGIAHDFNNLLAVILNDLSYALDELPDESAAATDVANARATAERAAALTRQLLIFARRDPVEPVDVDLDAVVTQLSPMLARIAGSHIEVRYDLVAGDARVRADPSRLEQVLLNLVVNARDAMPHGGTLRIGTTVVPIEGGRSDLEPGEYVCLSVTDTGEGMPEDVRERAFEPFFTTKPAGQGSGLGLATVLGVATQAGGTAAVHSRFGHGTVVTVWLPRLGGHRDAPAQAPGRPVTTILLVDDDADVRRAARRVLEGAGYRVLEAVDTTQATQVWLAHPPGIDGVVTDLVMPGRPIVELLADMRQRRPDLPVVVVSGSAPEAPAEVVPPCAFVRKPFTREELAAAVSGLLPRA